MVRPSRNLDQALLASGAALYPALGCAGLTVRAVAVHAGVTAGMFHYHFASKEEFLRQVLQGFYEDLFDQLSVSAAQPGSPLVRLRATLLRGARFLRDQAPLLQRVLVDAHAGEAVARDFLQRNLPRHIQLVLQLMDEGERAGELPPQPPLLRMTFLFGAVIAPLLAGSALRDAGLVPALAVPLIEPQVLSDAAINRRIDLALRALTQKGENHAD
jgi:AcrR family transcriptional regulator